MLNKKKNNKGFTLVELLVVIAIIGILAVVAIPALMSNLEKAKVAKLEADYNVISTGVVTFYADHNEYPQVADLVAKGSKEVTGKTTNTNIEDVDMSGYVSEVANPFKATYALNYTDKPETLEIVITDAKINKAGIAKLENDLGKDKVKYNSGTLKIAVVGTATTTTD